VKKEERILKTGDRRQNKEKKNREEGIAFGRKKPLA
jgi:hypothetical protein